MDFWRYSHERSKTGRKRSLPVTMFWMLVRVYLFMALALFCFQNRLLFLCPKADPVYVQQLSRSYPEIEPIRLVAPDRTVLRGWFVKGSARGRSPLVIYFGGNAEEVSPLVEETARFSGYSLLLMNYRGYGRSEGTPNERNLYRDAEFIYDEIVIRPDVDGSRVVLMGRSLGTGVAVNLAAKRKVKALILVTPYDSMVDVVQEKYKFLPISLMLLNRFDSISKAPMIKAPLLALIAGDDEVIPPWHAKRLVKRWGGPVKTAIIEAVGHNTIQESERYWFDIKEFLAEVER